MSWHFSQALEAAFLAANSLDGKQSALWSSMPFAQDDSCSDKMRGTCHRSPFGTMYVLLTDARSEELLTWFLAAFPAKDIPQQLRGKIMQTISGRKSCGSWQMSLPGTYGLRTSVSKRLIGQQTTLKRWVIPSAASKWPRRTWVQTMYGNDIGFLHTPTCTANYAAKSMQKWKCAQEFVRVFGRPTPTNHEWLMDWPIGWTDSKPLETGKFQQWLQKHGNF